MDRDDIRALRAALLRTEELRADLLRLAARVVALEEALVARGDDPAALGAALDAREATALAQIRGADVASPDRLHLGDPVDKYAVTAADGPPCAELIPICGARCCRLTFALTTQDLDEGLLKFDLGRPYLIRHDEDGHCSHLDRGSRGCGVYAARPAICRQYDCRTDARIWRDYAARELAVDPPDDRDEHGFELLERAQQRELAMAGEAWSVRRRP